MDNFDYPELLCVYKRGLSEPSKNRNYYLSKGKVERINHAVTITSVLSKQRGKHATSVILRNDLFEASCLVQPKLKEIDFLLASLSIKNKLMSGSGSAMFCLHRTKKEAERIGRQIKKRKPKFKVFSCHTY